MLEIINFFTGNCSNPGILGNADNSGKADNIAGNAGILGCHHQDCIAMLNVYCEPLSKKCCCSIITSSLANPYANLMHYRLLANIPHALETRYTD